MFPGGMPHGVDRFLRAQWIGDGCWNGFLRCAIYCVGQEITQALLASGQFDAMTPRMDEDEHSIEMHLPFIKKVRNT